MPPPKVQSRFWRISRTMFRWFRIFCLLVILVAVFSFIYFNRVGLPQFVKRPLLTELRERGVELEFERIRWRWFKGFVAENVVIGKAHTTNSPQFFAEQVVVRMNEEALKGFKFKVDALVLDQGNVTVPLVSTNALPLKFTATDIHTELRFLPDDQWELAQFEAKCFGMKLNVSGIVTNASALRRPPKPGLPGAPPPGPPAWERTLRQVVQLAEDIKFTGMPELDLKVEADARLTNQFNALLKFKADSVRSPWGSADHVLLSWPVRGSDPTNATMITELKVDLQNAQTAWADAWRVRGTLNLERSWTNRMPVSVQADLRLTGARSRWVTAEDATLIIRTRPEDVAGANWHTMIDLAADRWKTEWAQAGSAIIKADLLHGLTNQVPHSAQLNLKLEQPATRWATARSAELTLNAITNPAAKFDASWGLWTNLAPYQFTWQLQADQPRADKYQLATTNLVFNGRWLAPELVVEKFDASLYGGRVTAAVGLDVATRHTQGEVAFDFDTFKVTHLLKTNTQQWLAQFEFAKPPRVEARAEVVLPAWTNAPAAWKGDELLPTLRVDAKVDTGPGSYRKLAFSSAQTSLILSNTTLRLPNLRATRPEGEARVNYVTDSKTKDYQWQIAHLSFDPEIARPLLEAEKQLKVFDQFKFTAPPVLSGQIIGRWHAREETEASLHLQATNFSFKGEQVDYVEGDARYAEGLVNLDRVKVMQGERQVTCTHAEIDIEKQWMFFTNVLSTVDPTIALRLIGEKTLKALRPYQFHSPPAIRANGGFHFKNHKISDLHFDISGGPFTWTKFNVPTITGTVDWVTNTVSITNLISDFYGGQLKGHGFFDFSPVKGADFNFHFTALNSKLQLLMPDIVTSKTNKLEGDFDADLVVTSATTEDWKSWEGYGHAQMRDGFLWDIPLFGLFTKLFESITPGLGTSRVREAGMTFVITNSVILTRDMELKSSAMRLKYDGTIDFDTHVNAQVEAQLFRDTWDGVLRPFTFWLTPITKLLKYKVTGSLHNPKQEPLYIPKIFMMPFHPLKSMKDLFDTTPKDQEKAPKNDKIAPPEDAKPEPKPPQ